MARLLSAYTGDITSWRATSDFVSAYRQALLSHIASDHTTDAEGLFDAAQAAIEAVAAENRTIQARLNGVMEEVALTDDLDWHKELTAVFFRNLYRQFDLLHSAPAFYHGSMSFLRQICAVLVQHTLTQLGRAAVHLPQISLVALGPAGRCEYSPFCPLQVVLMHADTTAAERETVVYFGQILHSGFEALGLHIDPIVTPRNPEWCGDLAEWRQRCSAGIEQPTEEFLIDQLRLADQYQLYPSDGADQQLKAACSSQLQANRPALTSLIARMEALSNGLGLMGGLKLEKSGPARGMFALLQHGLLPLSAAISALALIKGSQLESTSNRVHDLLARHLLDVDTAERVLSSWHTLHELRLFRERAFSDGPYSSQAQYLNLQELQPTHRAALKEALESVAVIQRQVATAFSVIEREE
jgi:CBS domain-containing protein